MTLFPTVSVIVPAYNAQSTLRACLASLCALTYPSSQTEILVVDNGSRDGTRSIIESFASRVQGLEEPKRGPAAARNCGIRHARGEIIAFTDADCVVEPQWLEYLVQPFADPEVGIVGGAIRALHPRNPVELFGEHIHNHENALTVYQPAYAITMNWASPRRVLTDLGGFDESLRRSEDTDLAWRIMQHKKRLIYQPRAVIAHCNEHTLRGLFYEGVQHGYYSVPVSRKHQEFLQTFGYRRIARYSYVRLVSGLRRYIKTRSIEALCDFTFNAGKKVGKLAGSIRGGYIDL